MKKIKEIFLKIKTFLPKSWLFWSMIFFIIGVIIIFLIASIVLFKQQLFRSTATVNQSDFIKYYRIIDGQSVSSEKVNLRPIAVMIENHVDSRPASGLDQASIIYESVVEGDITRFLAIFPGDFTAKKIGPVRSARPFFIELAKEWQPVYLHSGGSPEALSILKQADDLYNLDEISANGIYFWRNYQRVAPHNLYTSADLVNRAVSAKGIATTTDILAWQFKNDSPVDQPTDQDILVDLSTDDNYNPTFHYNQQTNDYTRYINGQVDKTTDGVFLKTKNLVLQYVRHRVIDDYGRLSVDLDSGGRADVYQDGVKIEGSWRKVDGRTYFYNQQNEEVKFNRGKIWIGLVF
ncbi:MAG: DUF3048 domain-containing protein [Candidatus Buchananbacteria bacterium]|nr:DUF3048 domain-containing protein [Candidatus Buchananbacteria bacterium]